MMQFVVFSLLCQLLASATVSAESTFFNKFDPNPIASTINEHSEGDAFFVSASQELTQKQLIINDFQLFYTAKESELFALKLKLIQEEMSVTDEQLKNYTELVSRFASSAERLVFSTVSNRSDQSFVTLRNETEVFRQDIFKFYGTMNQEYVLQEFVDTFIEITKTTLDAITQDESTRKPILSKLAELKKNNTRSFLDSKETEIYHDLCKLDPGNIFFQQSSKPQVTRLAKLVRLIEQVKAKHHPDYVIMLEYYYGQLFSGFNSFQNCQTEYPNLDLAGQSKLWEHDPVLEAFQQKLGIHLTSSSASSVASRLMVALSMVAVLFLTS